MAVEEEEPTEAEDEDSIYDDEAREERFKNDELDANEDAFMRGYEEDMEKEKGSGDFGTDFFGEEEEKKSSSEEPEEQ